MLNMYCPIPLKRPKVDSHCLICSEDSFSGNNNHNGELTSIFLNYLFPQEDQEKITIKLLPLFTFCKKCAQILNKLIDLHQRFECIQNDIKDVISNIKCSILINCCQNNATDVNIRKFRKIATRDYCPVLKLKKTDFIPRKSTSTNEIDLGKSQNETASSLQIQRDSIIVNHSKPKSQESSSVDVLKLVSNEISCIMQENSLETSSSVDATTLSLPSARTASSNPDISLDTNQSAVESRMSDHQSISDNSELAEEAEAEPSPIRTEVIIEVDPNFNFEEEETVKFVPWHQVNQEIENPQRVNQIKEFAEHIIHSSNYAFRTPQQSHNDESKKPNESPTLGTAVMHSMPLQNTVQWTPPPPEYVQNVDTYSQTMAQTQNRSKGHSTQIWKPKEANSHVITTQSPGLQNVTNANTICRSTNIWRPEGFSTINVSPIAVNQNNPNNSNNNVIRTRLIEHMVQRQTINEETSLPPYLSFSSTKFERPPFTFAQLIFIAITNSTSHCATTENIWNFIVDMFPFYKDHYDMKKLANQVLTLGVAFEECTPTSSSSNPPSSAWFVKRLAVDDFITQIVRQMKSCTLSPSSYMKDPDNHLKKSLGNEYKSVLPSTSHFACSNVSDHVEDAESVNSPQENFEDDDIKIVQEISRWPENNELVVSSTSTEPNAKIWDNPPVPQSVLAAFVVAGSEEDGFTCPAMSELISTTFPAYEKNKDTLPKRLYVSLTTSRFFLKVFSGGSPYSVFYLNSGNEKAMQDLKKEFRKFSSLNAEYIFSCMANPLELENMAKKILGADFDCLVGIYLQRIKEHASKIN